MTKEWEREFAVSRMREDPTISYRALAKVLDLSDQTVRRWRDEEGIQPRPHHNTGRRRNGTRSASWPGKPVQPVILPTRNHDDGYEGDEDQEDEEEAFDLDDAPADSHAASLAQTWETIGKMGGLFGFLKPPTSHRSTLTPPSNPRRPTIPEDPKARLGAISAEMRARKPRGPYAVKLLVEAASLLIGGVNALPQYGEGLGCDPEDIATAGRIVVGKEKGR